MTRQKKEIIKKINDLYTWMAADEELGCGFAPPNAYAETEQEIYRLQEELAHLQHYANAEEMFYDTRSCEGSGCPW